MTLPPKALTVLASIRAELVSRPTQDKPVEEAPVKHRKTVLRSSSKAAYARSNAFQRMCQNRDWASPIY